MIGDEECGTVRNIAKKSSGAKENRIERRIKHYKLGLSKVLPET